MQTEKYTYVLYANEALMKRYVLQFISLATNAKHVTTKCDNSPE